MLAAAEIRNFAAMMNEQTRRFISEHADDNIRLLALQGDKYAGVDLPLALDQIAGRQVARRKLPAWAAIEGIVYPPHLSMEQCSSEQTARYKAALAASLLARDGVESGSCAGNPVFVDLTGGFGVDFSFIATALKTEEGEGCVYVEQQQHLCELVRHNLSLLGLSGSTVVCGDGVDYLHRLHRAGIIFLDPARRDAHGGRTYSIQDCTPDVSGLCDELLEKGLFVMLKLSPMLDWRKAIGDLRGTCEVHILSVGNECKELLLVLSAQKKGALRIFCVNDADTFTFSYEDKDASAAPSGLLSADAASFSVLRDSFLYEPNASIMKAGCFAQLCRQFEVRSLHPNSHLFVASSLISDFPGRRFKIRNVSTMNKKELKKVMGGLSKANVSVRNFPIGAEELRRRLKLKDGGDTYLFGTTLADKTHVLLFCQRADNP